MSTAIGSYFDHAQLSMAAYAGLNPTITDQDYKTALKEEGFSEAQATTFVNTYSVAKVFNDPATNFSATLFQKRGSTEKILAIRGTESWQDLVISDLQIGLFGLTNQYQSLRNFLPQIISQIQPGDTLTVTGHSLGGFLAQVFTLDNQNLVSQAYTTNTPGLGGVLFNPLALFGVTGDVVSNPLITNLIAQGHYFVASQGRQFGIPQYVFIEQSLNPLDNHGKMSITDALALYGGFVKIDPNLTIQKISGILEAASQVSDRSLESALDALRKVLQGPDITSTPISSPLTEDGSSAARNTYYANLLALQQALPPGSFRITSLTDLPSSAMFSLAKSQTLDGLAYRYALRELNPFAVIGADYSQHNMDGSLDLYDAQTGNGTMTALYLSDRAELLTKRLAVNVNDGGVIATDTHFVDMWTGFEVGSVASTNEVIFGDAQDNRDLLGHAGGDHLYGGEGDDFLMGQGGMDYLEGNQGNDELYGGSENDILLGQQGNDQLYGEADNDRLNGGLGNDLLEGGAGIDTLMGGAGIDLLRGGTENDILIGGAGDDLLEGGAGFDTYIYSSLTDGSDTIEDSDATGIIKVNGHVLTGGIKKAGDANWVSPDGQFTYRLEGGHLKLTLNGNTLTINENFQSGQFGIELRDLSTLPVDTGVPTGPFDQIDVGGNENNTYWYGGSMTFAIYGNGGNDEILDTGVDYGKVNPDLLDGGSGDDILAGMHGGDYLIGGSGNDYAMVEDGDIFLGGEDNDRAIADTRISYYTLTYVGDGSHYIDGGAGNDVLLGALGIDVFLGGEGDDILRGENRPEGWIAKLTSGSGYSDYAMAAFASTVGAGDYLDGGAGNDLLVGDVGDDTLLGGAGNDILHGESDFAVSVPGNDWLDGGDGTDQLFGGLGEDALYGGNGDDLLVGDYANEPGADDILDGGAGIDELHGGGGNDLLIGGSENDRLFAQDGEDDLSGDAGDDELQGGLGDDALFGGTGADQLFGQEGNDSLFGEDGDDLVNGGLGNDDLDGGEGIDDVQGREGDDFLAGGEGNDFLYGDGNDPTVLSLVGGNDSLDGEEGDDLLWGGAGQDQLFGGDGADQLVGDNGNDQLYGEAGNDMLVGDSTLFPAQAGTDLLDGGDGNDVLQGGGGDDELEGGDGDDVLFGEFGSVLGAPVGNDELHGGLGNDRLVGGGGLDTYRFDLGDGRDSIEDNAIQSNRLVFGAGITAEGLSLDVATGDSLLLRVGNNGDVLEIVGFGVSLPTDFHSIRQFEFADGTILTDSQLLARGFHLSAPVTGGTVLGTVYADHIEGSAVDDWIHGRDGNDILNGGLGNDVLEGEEGDDELDGGAGNDRLYGSAGSNVLRGGAGNDLLDSAGVGDQLFGGTGDDNYHFWSASQIIGEDVNAGIDTVHLAPTASLTFQTPDNVENVTIQDDFPLDPTMQVNMVGNVLDNVLSGSHRLDGQAGNDILIGFGDNTFVFGRGYGHDTVQTGTQWYAHTGLDQLEFVADIAPADLLLENHANDLVVKINGTTDQLTVQSYFVSPSTTVDQLVFAGGTVWGLTEIESRVQIFVGSEADETFYGTVNDDTIRSLGGNDQIRASSGNDTLDGGTGNDFLEGGSGNDTYVFGLGYGQDSIDEQGDSADVDILQLEGINPGDITLRATPDFMTDAILTINNTADQLTLAGFFAFDSLRVDRFQFADGTVWDYNAMLAHTEGVTLDGTEDADFLYGNVTNDTLAGFGGDDSLNGGAGNDTLDGGSGIDTMTGGTGNDVYVVDDPGDLVTEQANQGTDTVQVDITYTLGTNLERLTLMGTAAINGTGNGGNNTLTGNSAANVLTGGTGNDTYVVGIGDTVVEQASSGTDTIQSSLSWTLGTNVENLTLTGTSAINGTGNTLNNNLIGNSGNNSLDGSSGADAMSGGAGDDTYMVDNTGDTVTENANEGIDTVQSTVTYTLGANVDNLTLTGTTAINGTGNGLNNVLTGNSAANVLNGRTGADTMAGGAGNDTYVVEDAGDVVTEAVGGGTDLVQSSVTYVLGSEVENLTLTGSLAINGTGNALNNSLTGNTGNNTLDGGAGADAMSGGTGNDTYIVDNVGDAITEAASAGADTVQSSVTFTLGANIENLTLTGTSAINGTGNTLNNTLIGNSGANVLRGGTGVDAMSGGAGDDTYVVDNAGDTVAENANEGIDTVQSSLTYILGANVENLTLMGTTAINGTGNALDNVITGNSGANVLTGGAGNDTYVVGTGDTVAEQANAGIDTVQSAITWTLGANLENLTLIGTTAINGTGNTLDNVLAGNSAANVLTGGAGNDTYVIGTGDSLVENSGAGTDTVQSSITYTLGTNLENLTLIGTAAINGTGNASNNMMSGNSANNVLTGLGGNDTYSYGRGGGQDIVIDNSGTADSVLFGATIDPLDLVISRQVNDLRLAIHGSTDSITIQSWYSSTSNQTETLQASNGQVLLNTQVDQLIQAMASFSQQTGLTWDQAIDQRPQEVQTVLAANWH